MSEELRLDYEAAAVHAERWRDEADGARCVSNWFGGRSGYA